MDCISYVWVRVCVRAFFLNFFFMLREYDLAPKSPLLHYLKHSFKLSTVYKCLSTSCPYAKLKPKYLLSGSCHLVCATSFGARLGTVELGSGVMVCGT